MRILTDCPERIGGLAPGGSAWTQTGAGALTAEEKTLWQALGGGASLWSGEAEVEAAVRFWSRLIVVAAAPDSQFTVVNELLRGGLSLSGPVACLALQGQNFRGQRGRKWAALPGNLHLTVAVEPAHLPARQSTALTMLPAVAVVEAIRALAGPTPPARIKWVNDILIEGRKVAGVLTSTQVLGERITHFIMGIGLNVACSPGIPLTPFVPAIGSLVEAGVHVSLAEALLRLLSRLADRWARLQEDGPEALLSAYKAHSLVIGREVCIWDEPAGEGEQGLTLPPPRLCGTVRDIGPDLCLYLEGSDIPVTRGRLAFAEHLPPR
jgi:biotin-[acetyl-CoA-carboxylase] ligase BirA-like protein